MKVTYSALKCGHISKISRAKMSIVLDFWSLAHREVTMLWIRVTTMNLTQHLQGKIFRPLIVQINTDDCDLEYA